MRNFNHLYYFYIVAKLKNVTKAARYLNTSQPSLSTQIKTLEHTFKKKLFDKIGRNIELTADGHRVYQYCHKMFAIHQELEDFILTKKSDKKTLRIGFSEEIYRPFVTKIMSLTLKSIKAEEKPKIIIDVSSHESLIEKYQMNQLDFVLTNHKSENVDDEEIQTIPLPIVFVATKNFMTEQKFTKKITDTKMLKILASHIALPGKKSKLRLEINKFFQTQKIPLSPLIESDILSTVVKSTLDGFTCALLPAIYLNKELSTGALKRLGLQTGLWNHHLYLHAHLKPGLSPFLKAFNSHLLSLSK